MVQWTNRLMIGEKLRKKKNKVIASIQKRQATFDVYCITISKQQGNLFDIMDANQLLFPHYKNFDVSIVGLAKGYDEAISLVQDMLMEVYEKTGDFDVRTYFT